MSFHPHITVYGRDDRRQLIVEVTGQTGITSKDAAEYRSMVLARSEYADSPRVPFFMLASRDRFFLWLRDRPVSDVVLPDYVTDARPLLEPLIDSSMLDLKTIPAWALLLFVASWLGDLTYHDPERRNANGWVAESGLYDSIQNGLVQVKEAA